MDWRKQRNQRLAKARRVLIKVGSAVLTTGTGLDADVIESLAAQIAALHARGLDVILVSSGAVAAGRKALAGLKLSGIAAKQAAAAVGQSRLMLAWDEAFAAHSVTTAQILLTRDDLESRDRHLHIRNTLRILREWRVIPVINENDSVAVQELIFGDNDQLSSLLAGACGADLAVNLTSAAGVFASDPTSCPGLAPLDHVADIDALDLEAMCGDKTAVGSGGMYSKLSAAKRVAKLGVPTLILPGREPHALTRAFAGQDVGTWIGAGQQAVSRRKYWLGFSTNPKGTLIVDAGAETALTQRGKSLLAAGITQVSGDFEAGDAVRIDAVDGRHLGVGLTNYSSADLTRIKGVKSAAIESILGQAPYPEAVHRDNLLIDADA